MKTVAESRSKRPSKKIIPAPPDSNVTRKRPRLTQVAPQSDNAAPSHAVAAPPAPTTTTPANGRTEAQARVLQNLGMLEHVVARLDDPTRDGAQRLIDEVLEDLQELGAFAKDDGPKPLRPKFPARIWAEVEDEVFGGDVEIEPGLDGFDKAKPSALLAHCLSSNSSSGGGPSAISAGLRQATRELSFLTMCIEGKSAAHEIAPEIIGAVTGGIERRLKVLTNLVERAMSVVELGSRS